MYNFTKRTIDLAFAITFLALSLPVFLLIMLVLSITGDKEIFYLQERVGYKNKRFFICKFATMFVNSEYNGNGQFTLANDTRVTPFGRMLRKTKLNELPQLINILKGDMSLVGPRPLMPESFDRYSDDVQNRIYNIQPGLTGVGSIIFRDEVKLLNNCSDYDNLYKKINAHKGKLEIWYQKNRGIRIDFVILFLTGLSIFFPNQTLIYKVFKNLPLLSDENEINLSVRQISKKRIAHRKVEFGM